MKEKFSGVGPAMVTPFNKNGEIDWVGLDRLTKHLIKNGVDYLVVQGTTGESPTLSSREKADILMRIAEINNKELPIVFGMGGNNTAALINDLKETNLDSADAILSVCPYYNKPSQKGIEEHFLKIADSCPVPVILYNVPSRTGSNINANTIAKLSVHENIIGVKEASGSMDQALEIKQKTDDAFLLISGEDLLTVPMIGIGAVGVISVLANAFTKEFCDMIHSALKNDFSKAEKINAKFLGIDPLMYQEGNPVGIKASLELKGICGPMVRLPMSKASPQLTDEIKEEIKKAAL
jgi:4-hydroxy-tetrahydrodipicolinate synthase